MRLHDLTADQLRRLRNRLFTELQFIKKLRVRMEETEFPPDDRFTIDVTVIEAMLRDAVALVETAWNVKCTRAHDRGKRFPR